MELPVLKSLATCSLRPHVEGRTYILTGTDANGAEEPADVADAALDVPAAQSIMFQAGFDFALDVAAAITEDLSHSPDLTSAIAAATARIAEFVKEAA
jgi:hypothetical protein